MGYACSYVYVCGVCMCGVCVCMCMVCVCICGVCMYLYGVCVYVCVFVCVCVCMCLQVGKQVATFYGLVTSHKPINARIIENNSR